MKRTAAAMTKVQATIVIVVVVVAAVVIGAYYFLMQPSGPEYIKIGWPAPITGVLAGFAETTPWVVQQVEDYVNKELGGVHLSEYNRKVFIKVILRDTKSDSDQAATIAAELITKENIDIMLALYSPAMTNPISAQCEKYGVPCIVSQTIIISWLMGGPYEWSYCIGLAEPDYAVLFFDLFDSAGEQVNKIVAMINADDPDGRGYSESINRVAAARGYTIVDAGLVPYGTSDYSSYIYTWKSANAQILTGNMRSVEFAALWRQCNELGYKPKIVAMSRALLFPSWVEAIGGDLPNGLIGYTWWSGYHPYRSSITGQTTSQLIEAWESYSKKQWTPVLGLTHCVLEVAIDAVKRAGSLDKTRIKEALANINLNTIAGPINFKAPLTPQQQARYQAVSSLIQYKDHYVVVKPVAIQWVKGTKWPWEMQIIYNWESPEIPETAEMFLLS
ncbi:ABC transporter substrate-binding protein [Candidatus Bathyarchaeota archaeon]|nr:ABC transporter substrate-binding protein [Candidatus Bathyarchaeota archaeon]